MLGAQVKPITKWQRFRSSHLGLYALLLGVVCLLLPLLFWPPFVRKELYSTLTMAKFFAMGGEPTAVERRPWGLRIWDKYHPHSVPIASALLVIGVPTGLWVFINLGTLWTTDSQTLLTTRLNIIQLLSATLVGGVAIGVFLTFQLPRMQTPRVHTCFALADPKSNEGFLFLNLLEYTVSLTAERGTWLHVRVANVGTIYYPRFTVSLEIPRGWSVATVQRADRAEGQRIDWHITGHPSISSDAAMDDNQRPVHLRPYTYNSVRHRLSFEPRDDPQDTGPGASSVYSYYVIPSQPEAGRNPQIRVYVSSDQAGGQTVKTLNVNVAAPVAKTPLG